MATVAKSDRSTLITLASATAGPFDLDFRLFDTDTLDVFVNYEPRTDWTLNATFIDGFTDSAAITFDDALADSDVIVINGELYPDRPDDYLNSGGLVKKLNVELGRIWSSLSEQYRNNRRSLRFFQPVAPVQLEADRALVGNPAGDGVAMGPSIDEIENAQSYAERAEAAAETIEGAITVNAVGMASGTGSTTVFSLPIAVDTKNNVDVIINGVQQFKSSYEVSGNQITFVTAPPAGTNNIEFNCKGDFSGVVDAQLDLMFDGRAALESWIAAGNTVAAGKILHDGTVSYTFIPVGHALYGTDPLPRLPGLMEFGTAVPEHFGVSESAADNGSDLAAAMEYPHLLDWGSGVYGFTTAIDVARTSALRWRSSGCRLEYSGVAAKFAITIEVPTGQNSRIDGRLTCDGGGAAYSAWSINAATEIADDLADWPSIRADGLSAENWYRAGTEFTGGDGVVFGGGFYRVEYLNGVLKNGLMADGAQVFGSQGVFGATTLTYNSLRPRHVRFHGHHVENIASENPSYPFDQDGFRVFQDLGTGDDPDGPTCTVTNITSINVVNRTLKLHSGVTPIVRGVHITKDNDTMGRNHCMLRFGSSVDVVLGETLTQASSGASAKVLDDGGGSLVYTGTEDVYLEDISGTFDEAGDVVGSTSGSLGIPATVHLNLSANPDIDFQQSPGILSDVNFWYNDFCQDYIATLSYRDEYQYGGQLISGVRGKVSGFTTSKYTGVFNIRGNATTQNSNIRAAIAVVDIEGNAFRDAVITSSNTGGKSYLNLESVTVPVIENFVTYFGDAAVDQTVVAVACINTATAVPFLSDAASATTLKTIGCDGFTDLNEVDFSDGNARFFSGGNEVVTFSTAGNGTFLGGTVTAKGNNPTLVLEDTSASGTAATGHVREIDDIMYFYANVDAEGTGGVNGGFEFRGYGTNSLYRLLKLDADKTVVTYGDLVAGGVVFPKTHTVAGAPDPTIKVSGVIYVSDGDAGSPCLAVSDGTDWLRVPLGTAISAT